MTTKEIINQAIKQLKSLPSREAMMLYAILVVIDAALDDGHLDRIGHMMHAFSEQRIHELKAEIRRN